MPCTRSMRSKSKTEGDEVTQDVPKTRSTRTRTVSKSKKKTEESVAELKSESPTPSATSGRSTRTRTRNKAKVQVPDEKFEVVEIPDSPVAKRSVRQKPAPVGKGAKKTVKKQETEKEDEGEPDEMLSDEAPSALKSKGKEETKAWASKKIQLELPSKSKPEQTVRKATAKKRKAPSARTRGRNNGPSESDDMSTDQEENNTRRRRRLLTVDELHKYFVTPLKSAFHAVEVVPKFMESIMDSEAVKEQEEEFQRLLHRYDMPPPKKDNGRGRTRKKRGRSPEPTTSKTEIPQSFDFTEAPVGPAAKKMIVDYSGTSIVPNVAQEEEEVVMMEVDNEDLSPEKDKNTAEKLNEEKQQPSVKTREDAASTNSKEQSNVPQTFASKPKKKEKVGIVSSLVNFFDTTKKEPIKLPATSTHKVAKPKNVPSSGSEAETKVVANNNDPNATFVVPSTTTEKKANPSLLMNVTQSFEKPPVPVAELPAMSKPKQKIFETPAVPVMPPSLLRNFPQESDPTLLQNSLASRTFIKEPSSDLVLEEAKGEAAIMSSKPEKLTKDPNKAATKPESTKTGKLGAADKQQEKDVSNSKPREEAEGKTNLLLNVTVCIEKPSAPVVHTSAKQNFKAPPVPVMPPRLGNIPQEGNPSFVNDSPANLTFTKEQPLVAVMEEEEGKSSLMSNKNEKSSKAPAKTTATIINEPSVKGILSSTTSSSCPLKPAGTSQSTLTAKDKKNPVPGSAGKQQDVYNSKPLEEAEKRRQELLRQKTELAKKKREDWEKKREKLEEEKKLKETQKQLVQPPPTNNHPSKKPPAKIPNVVAPISAGFMKPKAPSSHPVPFPIKPFPAGSSSITSQTVALKALYKKPPPLLTDIDMDDSFKSLGASNSFLDATADGSLNSYDITVYEDLDEDLKHRENKPIPDWASDRSSLKTALFSMVLLPDYEYKYSKTFPKADRSFKLFPNK